jgi:hypothetical protein
MMTSYYLAIAGYICLESLIDKRLFVPEYMSKCHPNDLDPDRGSSSKKAGRFQWLPAFPR